MAKLCSSANFPETGQKIAGTQRECREITISGSLSTNLPCWGLILKLLSWRNQPFGRTGWVFMSAKTVCRPILGAERIAHYHRPKFSSFSCRKQYFIWQHTSLLHGEPDNKFTAPSFNHCLLPFCKPPIPPLFGSCANDCGKLGKICLLKKSAAHFGESEPKIALDHHFEQWESWKKFSEVIHHLPVLFSIMLLFVLRRTKPSHNRYKAKMDNNTVAV